MRKAVFSLMALATALISTSPARADVRGRELTFSPFIGVKSFDGSQNLYPGFAAGMRLGYNLTRNWGVEGQFTYALAKATNSNYYSQYSAGGDLLYHLFPAGKLVPFIVLGGGLSRSENSIGNSHGGMLDYGAGVKYFVDHLAALRMDVRQIVAFSPINSGATHYWQNTEFNVGLCYQFGGASPATPAAEVQNVWLAEQTQAPPGKVMITGMKVEQNMLGIMATERITDYKVFTLTQPSRLVIDIGNGVSGFTAKSIALDRLGIAAVRFESYPDYLRIYLDGTGGRLIPYRIEATDQGLKVVVTAP